MTVYKRRNSPYYQAEFVIGGRRFRRSTQETTEREAKRVERQFKAQARESIRTPVARSDLTLDTATGRFWLEVGHRRRDARDVKRWLTYVLRYMDRNLPLSDLAARHVADFVAEMRALGIGEISINRTVTTLQGVHNRAAKVWEEPVKVIGWKPFKSKERGREHWITQDQAKALRHSTYSCGFLKILDRVLFSWRMSMGLPILEKRGLPRSSPFDRSCFLRLAVRTRD